MDVAAAGIIGNLYAESRLKAVDLQGTTLEQSQTYTDSVDSGKISRKEFAYDSKGYGIAQWTYWSRKQKLYDFAKEQGKSIGDLGLQLDFLWLEISENEKLMKKLSDAKSVLEASNAILHDYERPAKRDKTVEKKRAEFGEMLLGKIKEELWKN